MGVLLNGFVFLYSQRFKLAAGEAKMFECRVTAVRSGYLLLPQPKLAGVPADQTAHEHRARQIHIYPAAHRTVVELAK